MILLVLGVIGGSVLGIVAFARMSGLQRRVELLQRQQQELVEMVKALRAGTDPAVQPTTSAAPASPSPAPETTAAPAASPLTQPMERPTTLPASRREAPDTESEREDVPVYEAPRANRLTTLLKHISANWMVWLGGISLGLAGIFLVAYSIEQGLLGPTARIALGALAGLAMQAGAEYLRRRTKIGANVFAALAAAGSISLFATVLAALHLFEMIGINTAFVLLTLIALTTMALALLHGPLLAALGLLGAYLVPVLVASGSGEGLIALLYALIISAAALTLLRFVERPWLWWGALTGGLGWWLLTLGAEDVDGLRSLYLAALTALLAILPDLDWRLRRTCALATETYRVGNYFSGLPARDVRLFWGAGLILAAHGLSILADPTLSLLWLAPSALYAVVLWLSVRRENLNVMPWLFILITIAAWLGAFGQGDDNRVSLQWLPADGATAFLSYLGLTAALTVGVGLYGYAQLRFKALWATFVSVPPVLLLICGYLLTDQYADTWAIIALLVGLTQISVASAYARRASLEALNVWLYFGGQLAIASAAAIVFTPDTLTVVLATQLVSCAALMRSFEVDLSWLIKVLVTVLIVRLTLNPWLLSYPTDSHWTLWTYGGSTALALLTLRVLPTHTPERTRTWLEGAALHLGVLFLWTELRFWLNDGDVFGEQFSAVEISLYVVLFGLISVVYHLRAQRSEFAARLYIAFSRIAAGIALGSYGMILLAALFNLDWLNDGVDSTPIWNLGLLYFFAPVIVYALCYYFGERWLRSIWAATTGLSIFVYVSSQIRHLWSGGYRLDQPFTDGEVMTYSVAWLGLAVLILLRGAANTSPLIYRVGMGLLALVICKIFLLDLSGLQGLARVGSFFGLGLALLGLSYLHQRLSQRAQAE
ncbi:MAG: DUF2339 domain-containing protein [Pseudomonadota bacterium]